VSPRIRIDAEEVAAFCRKWKISRLELFGSVLRADFRPDSDVDVLVTYEPDARWSLLDAVRIEAELGAVLGRRVDLVSGHAIEQSYNWIRRQEILGSSRAIYGLALANGLDGGVQDESVESLHRQIAE